MIVFHKKLICEKPVEKGCGLLNVINLIIHNLSIENKEKIKIKLGMMSFVWIEEVKIDV